MQSPESGIIPRCVNTIFGSDLQKGTVVCSFIQVYNEKVYDLLKSEHTSGLQVREDKMLGIHVEGLSEFVVKNGLEAMNLV
jgi:hypothetical protein